MKKDHASLIPGSFDEENHNHNPSRLPVDLKPRPGILLIQRPAQPTGDSMSVGGVALPTKDRRGSSKTRAGQIDVDYPPNCGRVFAAGEGCKAEVGDYVFFYQRVDDPHEAYRRKPQPLIPFYDPLDQFPPIFAMHDEYVLATVKHVGDAARIEVVGNVEAMNISGKWSLMQGERLRMGERFRAYDENGNVGGVYVALSDAEQVSEDKVAVTAAPYNGPEV